jgi:sRNA-binding carbon storage regulator CsrA
MLRVDRHIGEALIIETPEGPVRVVVTANLTPGRVSLGIDAPRDWPILREELKTFNERSSKDRAGP